MLFTCKTYFKSSICYIKNVVSLEEITFIYLFITANELVGLIKH